MSAAVRNQKYKMLEHKRQNFDLPAFTCRTMAHLLQSKGSVLDLKSYVQIDQVGGFNLLKVFYVLKAAGFVYFIDDSKLTYLGTSRSILKFFKFAKDKVLRTEPEVETGPEKSEASDRGPQDYPFREPKDFKSLIGTGVSIGNWEFSAFEFNLLEDFCEQIIMEMHFDPSTLNRQVDQQELLRRTASRVQ